jgi:hypothetical protein
MSDNRPLAEGGLKVLSDLLGAGWAASIQDDPKGGPSGEGFFMGLLLASAGTGTTQLFLAPMRDVTPRDVTSVIETTAPLVRRLQPYIPFVVVAPDLPPGIQAMLREAELGYVCLDGNVFVRIPNSGIVIDRTVTTGAAEVRRRPGGYRLGGAKAGRIVRFLADVEPPYGVFDIAHTLNVDEGYVSKVLATLDREALIERSGRGVVSGVRWADLLRYRAQKYDVLGTNRARQYVCPQGPGYAMERLRDRALMSRRSFRLTGSFAAQRFVQVASPATLMLYVLRASSEFISDANLVETAVGANVVLLDPYDSVVTQNPYKEEGPLPVSFYWSSISQIALDCLTGPGRMPQEGEALLSWMEENLSEWRLKTPSQFIEKADAN